MTLSGEMTLFVTVEKWTLNTVPNYENCSGWMLKKTDCKPFSSASGREDENESINQCCLNDPVNN